MHPGDQVWVGKGCGCWPRCRIDVLFAVDLFINFRTAYWSHQGELVRDAKLISKRYVSFWFWIDLVATIPFDLLIRAAAGSSSASLTALGFLKTPRLLRLARWAAQRLMQACKLITS